MLLSVAVKVFFYTFFPKGNAFVSQLSIKFFIFFSRVSTQFILKSIPGINFFPKVSSHKWSACLFMISMTELVKKS